MWDIHWLVFHYFCPNHDSLSNNKYSLRVHSRRNACRRADHGETSGWSFPAAYCKTIWRGGWNINAIANHTQGTVFKLNSNIKPKGAVKLMRTRIGLLAQPKSMRSIIDATRQKQRHGSAWNWCVNRDDIRTKLPPNEFTRLILKDRGPIVHWLLVPGPRAYTRRCSDPGPGLM